MQSPIPHLLLRQPSRNGVNVILLDDVVSGLYVWHILETDGKVVGMGKVIVQ
ncbi:MAG TPA: hypothetical protein VI603_19335 [Saprospiraceae bacterium]|nr:hypothetical protein [Saprospiraceae bacterium]